MKIGFISYNANHLKTDQVLTNWSAKADPGTWGESWLFLIPFKNRPSREVLFHHRPPQSSGAHPAELGKAIGLNWAQCSGPDKIPTGMDLYVVLGAGLLPDEFVETQWVLNVHPGLIPYSRGLDSFKWAIYNQRRVGVTLHRLSKEVDLGAVWNKQMTPVTPSDSLESFARRHYELEINLLSRFDEFVGNRPEEVDTSQALPETRRMPEAIEEGLRESFEEYKEKFCSSGD